MMRVAVAKLTGIFGLKGELKCKPSVAGERSIAPGREYALGPEPGARFLRVRSARRHHDRWIVSFEGIETPEAARALAGRELFLEPGDVVLLEHEYLDADLVGLRLLDPAGRELGRVARVEHFPSQDMLVIEPGEALVPLVRAFVRDVDVAGGTIAVELPDGLL